MCKFLKRESADNGDKYLIWSIEHQKWWGPNSDGYVDYTDMAGRYTKEEATRIVKNANEYEKDPKECMIPEHMLRRILL